MPFMRTFRNRSHLSPRETDLVELVRIECRNRDLAARPGPIAATIKNTPTHVSDEVFIDMHTQLVARIA